MSVSRGSPAAIRTPLLRRAHGRLASPVSVSLIGKSLELVGLVALATLVPRVLGPADYGVFALALTIVTLGATSLTLGGPTVMARFVPVAANAERAGVARAIGARLAVGRAGQMALLAIIAAGLLIVAPATFPAVPTALVMAGLALNVAATLALQLSLGLGHTAAWSFRWGLQNTVLVAAVLTLHAAAGPTGAIAAIVLAAIAALALGLASVPKPLRAASAGGPLPAGAIRFGVLQAATGAATQVVHRGGVVAVAAVAGSSVETGYAALTVGVGLAAFYVVSQAFIVSLPGRVEVARADPIAAEAAVRRLAWSALAALVPAAAVGVALAGPALDLVLGPGFRAAEQAFTPALAFVVLAPLNAVALQAAALRLRPEAALWGAVGALVAFLGAAAVAVPAWGAPGAAVATLAGSIAAPLVTGARLPDALGRGLVVASLAGASLVLVAGRLL
jgi:O-antigen/teichoic acid export membrane protein